MLQLLPSSRRRTSRAFTALSVALLPALEHAQDRLKTMPGYDQFQRVAPQISTSVKSGALNVSWSPDGKSFDYFLDGARQRFDVAAKKSAAAAGDAPVAQGGRGGRGGAGVARGRQVASAISPDSTHKAFHRDRNLYVSDTAGRNEVAITSDGSEAKRIKYGTASWVYGEELGQTTAMWWNKIGTKVAFYRFDDVDVAGTRSEPSDRLGLFGRDRARLDLGGRVTGIGLQWHFLAFGNRPDHVADRVDRVTFEEVEHRTGEVRIDVVAGDEGAVLAPADDFVGTAELFGRVDQAKHAAVIDADHGHLDGIGVGGKQVACRLQGDGGVAAALERHVLLG